MAHHAVDAAICAHRIDMMQGNHPPNIQQRSKRHRKFSNGASATARSAMEQALTCMQPRIGSKGVRPCI
eukprot:scaffold138997_cov17-Tisochrysis_lutea.AAC.1